MVYPPYGEPSDTADDRWGGNFPNCEVIFPVTGSSCRSSVPSFSNKGEKPHAANR